MIIGIVLLISAVFSEEFQATTDYRRFTACRELVRVKLSEDREELEAFYSKFPGSKNANNAISTDMMSKCFSIISSDTAETILQQGKDLVLIGDFKELIELNLEAYEEKDLVFSQKHGEFYGAIDKLRESSEMEADEYEKKQRSIKPLFTAGPVYILAVGVVFAGIVYWAYSKVTYKKPKKTKSKRKNN